MAIVCGRGSPVPKGVTVALSANSGWLAGSNNLHKFQVLDRMSEGEFVSSSGVARGVVEAISIKVGVGPPPVMLGSLLI